MDGQPKAESIFEFLTARNPDVHHRTPKSLSLTTLRGSYYPTQLTTWDEFSFPTLEAIYNSSLMTEARRNDRSLSYPSVLAKIDDVVHDEPTTTHVLTIWNHRIVATALQAVQETLHPSIWVPSGRKGQNEADAKMTDAPTHKRKTGISARFKPDAGAVSFCQNCRPDVERLPKDYKTASKWKSSAIFDGWMAGPTGEWTPGQAGHPTAKPIRQVYTYCVEFGCRYGCIITTQEAFIFRIKPRTEMPVSGNADGCSRNKAAVRKALATDGLMEYVSIPWDRYRQGNPDNYSALTVNLALWFVHILAGNAHETGWNYPLLIDEKLTTEVCFAGNGSEKSASEPDIEESELPQTPSRHPFKLSSASRKRRRNSGASDDPRYSFAKLFESFTTQSTEQLTAESFQSCDYALERSRETDAERVGGSFDERVLERIRAPKRLRSGKILPAPVGK